MMALAILLCPWIMKMRTEGLRARVLADDVMVYTDDHDHTNTFIRGFETQLR